MDHNNQSQAEMLLPHVLVELSAFALGLIENKLKLKDGNILHSSNVFAINFKRCLMLTEGLHRYAV